MNKKVPLRSCSITREQLPKKELIRVVRTPEKIVKIDLNGKANGRGAYLKADVEVIKKAQKTKILEKKLEVKIEDEIYEDFIKIVGELIA